MHTRKASVRESRLENCTPLKQLLVEKVYLGGYEREDHAAEAYDVAALKCKGPRVKTNFPITKQASAILLHCLAISSALPSSSYPFRSTGMTAIRSHCMLHAACLSSCGVAGMRT